MMLRIWLTLFFVSPCLGKMSVNVPTESPDYRLLDRLEAYGCTRATFRALMPQGHADLRDALFASGEAAKNCMAPEWLRREGEILLRPGLSNDVRGGLYVFHDDTVSLPGIEARVDALFPLRRGRVSLNGPNLFTELLFNAEAGREIRIAVSATPAWVGGLDDFRHLNGRFYLHEGYLKLGWRRLELTYGRTALGFGEAEHGSLILSGAAKPLNVWKVGLRPSANAETLGPFSVETWLADQELTDFVTGARLWGISLGARPFDAFEFALLELYQFGGVGAPGLDSGDLLKMLWYSGGDDLAAKRNRSFALNLGVWGPSKFVKGYTQFFFHDFNSLGTLLSEDVSVLVGLWFPRVASGDVRFEYVHTVPGAYSHPFWRQGLTYQSTPLGHPVGEDAEAVYADVGLPPMNDMRPEIGFFYESRGRNAATSAVAEWRYGLGIEVQKRWGQFDFEAGVRYARVINRHFERGRKVHSIALLSTLRYSFF